MIFVSADVRTLAGALASGSGVSGIFAQGGWLVFGAVVGAALSYVATRMNARHDPRKKLAWEAETDRGLLAVSDRIRDNVSISYKGVSIEDIVAVRCNVVNTGNVVVKNERIRFSFPEGVLLLEGDFSPIPEPELNSSRVASSESGESERVFMIGHLEVGQQVSFELIATGNGVEKWQVHPFNEGGDVEFRQREAERITDDQEHVVPFVVNLLLLFIIPSMIEDFPGGIFAGGTALLARIVFLILIAPHILPMARLVRRLIEKQLAPTGVTTSVTVNGPKARVVASGSGTIGHVEFAENPELIN
jgi:hypothetical protein